MKKLILTSAVILFSLFTYAQPVPPTISGHGSGTNQTGGAGAPLDGGLSILLGVGILYGARKVNKIKMDKKEV